MCDHAYSFSITKWIHLNTLDVGLIAFFQRVFDTLKPGGSFVVEPQSWDSYGKAAKMSSVEIVLFSEAILRANVKPRN